MSPLDTAPALSHYASARDLPDRAPGAHYDNFVGAKELAMMNEESKRA